MRRTWRSGIVGQGDASRIGAERDADKPALGNRGLLRVTQGGNNRIVKSSTVEYATSKKTWAGDCAKYADNDHDGDQLNQGKTMLCDWIRTRFHFVMHPAIHGSELFAGRALWNFIGFVV